MRIFKVAQREIEIESGEWAGSLEQNCLADIKIAKYIYNSLQVYERGFKRYGSFFNFKKRP